MGSLIPIGFECFQATYDPKIKQLKIYVDGIVVSARATTGGLERDTKTTDKIRYSFLGYATGLGSLSPYKRFRTSISGTVSLLPPTPSPKAFVLIATAGQKDYVIPVNRVVQLFETHRRDDCRFEDTHFGQRRQAGDLVARVFAALPAVGAAKDSVVLQYEKDILSVWESGVKDGQLYWDLTWVKKPLESFEGAMMFSVLTNKWVEGAGWATTTQPYMLSPIVLTDV
ncbi:hypothetical protein MMC13_005891 [Lambiella insularis]|nr:hypothetical protein [Lambiella insularis]